MHRLQKTPVTENFENLFLEYKLQPGRLSIFKGIHKSIIIDSTYNASPLSMKKIIETAHTMKNELFPERKIAMLLGDMRELGEHTEQEHRKVAAYVQAVADDIFLL